MITKGSLRTGVIWNMASLVILAISGALLNVLIAAKYDASTLGVFNQVLSVYVFASCFAVGGISISTLKLIAEKSDSNRIHEIAISAILLTTFFSLCTTILFWTLRSPISSLLDSPGVYVGLTWITPGLFCFALNKTLLAIVNGLHHMRAFAVFQSLRYFNLLVGFFIAVAISFPGERLAYVFSFSEIILLFVLLIYLRKFFVWNKTLSIKQWFPVHFSFGVKSFLSGALLELNLKADVLILGYYSSDLTAGVYSFAAMVFEGLYQFFVVLQNNYNPILSKLLHERNHKIFIATFQSGHALVHKYARAIAPFLVALYPLGLRILFPNQPEFEESWLPFSILVLGLLISSGYLPFQNLLVMAGLPAWHSVYMFLILSINILGNIILVPRLGMVGSALGTSFSLLLGCILLIFMSKKCLRLGLHSKTLAE